MQKLLTFFQQKKITYKPYFMIKVLTILTNDIVSFEQQGPGDVTKNCRMSGKECRSDQMPLLAQGHLSQY